MKKSLFLALAILAGSLTTTAFAAKKKDKKKKTVETVEVVKLATSSDSLSYAAGKAQTNGLLPFLKQKYNVEEKDIADVARGFNDMYKNINDPKVQAYAAGQQIALMVEQGMLPYRKEQFKEYKDTINSELFNKGFIASLLKDDSLLSDSVAQAYMTEAEKANKECMEKATKKKGEEFLAENAKKEGVVTLPNGLQYKVITAGTGEKPKATDRVTVKYEGKSIDGKVFDSSYKRNPQTTTFGLNQVIKGWTEALQLMPVGSKWEIYIPYDLAYGERGSGRNIKPYEALIFTVELVDIEKPKAEVKVEEKTATKKATAKKKGITMKATPKAKKK